MLRWVSGGVRSPPMTADPPEMRCPHCDNDSVLGVIITAIHDGILYWQCEICEGTWHRFSDEIDPRLHWLAQKFMARERPPP